MSGQRFTFGDRVRHPKRPEWGVGSVVKVREQPVNGECTQCVDVRFPGVGVKSLVTSHVALQPVVEEKTPQPETEEANPVSIWDRVGESEWLAPVAQRKIEEAMISLPEEARDPFRSMHDRVAFSLALYRFDRSGRGLIEWAVAQTGLDDPLTRFNRHELEQFFDRWTTGRDAHLVQLLQELGPDRNGVRELLDNAPTSAQRIVRRVK